MLKINRKMIKGDFINGKRKKIDFFPSVLEYNNEDKRSVRLKKKSKKTQHRLIFLIAFNFMNAYFYRVIFSREAIKIKFLRKNLTIKSFSV